MSGKGNCYDNVAMLSGVVQHFISRCVVRGRCMTNQNKEPICYPDNQNLKIILIGDFNVSYPAKIRAWTNENNKLPIFELFNDPNVRNTSYHSGIKDRANNWMPDPDPYQKVDHLIHTLNLNQPRLDVYVSNNFMFDDIWMIGKNGGHTFRKI